MILPQKRRVPGDDKINGLRTVGQFVQLDFPMNFVTAPLIADLFLLAISAIGRQEVHDGTIGANNISPVDIMVFFLTLAYIAISIDASGLIRWLAFKVLQKGGKDGPRLYFYLYAFFFCLGSFIGNDPIILSGTAFLAYMTRVSSNIVHPRAWIVSQFAVANTASAILVSSNPTNLVLAGAFKIKFITYTANMIVPVVATALVLFPFLLWVVFADERFIPLAIEMRELPKEIGKHAPRNPNIPYARGNTEQEANATANEEQGKLLLLAEIMHPFLDRYGAAFGAVIMAVTLVTLLALNAVSQSQGEHPVFWVTLPAAVVMFCWDFMFGFINRKETRKNARQSPRVVELALSEPVIKPSEDEEKFSSVAQEQQIEAVYELDLTCSPTADLGPPSCPVPGLHAFENDSRAASVPASLHGTSASMLVSREDPLQHGRPSFVEAGTSEEKVEAVHVCSSNFPPRQSQASSESPALEQNGGKPNISELESACRQDLRKRTLVSLVTDTYRWLRESFPTVTVVVAHLPFMLVPFALSMFVLVQALVTKGWVPVFAHGWDHWVNKTGTIGSIGGMGFLSVVLCNVSSCLLNLSPGLLLDRPP